MNEPKDDPRDAHLLAALRHAPDRDATVPREVSERILAAARAAAQSSRMAVRTPWWQRLSAWLTQPQVAASFGTLVVASLVGVMWSTREPPVVEVTPPPAAAERVEPPRTPAPEITSQADALKSEASVATSPAAAVKEARPQTAPAPRPKQAPAKDALSPRDSGPETRQRAAAKAPAEAPAETAAVSPSAGPAAVVAAPAPQAADAAMSGVAAERRAASASDSRLPELNRQADAPKPATGAALGRALAAKANAAGDPLERWDEVLGVDTSDSVVWRRGDRRDAPPIAHGTAQMQWWAALRRATAGTWKAQTRSPQPAWLAFDVSGSPAGSIDLAGDAVIFCPAAAATTCWRAPITPAQREAWTAEVARW